jgi:tetratricopeptide (TPR) repeat protein
LEQALSRQQVQEARQMLEQLLKHPRIDPDTLLRVGIGLAQRDLYPEAARVFARCVKDHPEIFEAYYNLALAEFAEQKLPEALAVLEGAPHGSKAQDLARLYLRGKIQSVLGKMLEAEHDLSAAFSGAPQQENYALDLGLFYLRQQAYARAAEIFKRGASFNPHSPFLALGLSLAQFLGGRAPQSVETCKKLLILEPDFSPAHLLLAFALYMAGDLEAAEKVAAQSLAGPQASPYLYYLHAAILLRRRSADYDRILEELARASRAIPACTLCYLAQSKAHQALGDSNKAIADLETAVRLDPGFAEAWYRLAPLYQSLGRPAEAARAREQFRRIKAYKENRETEMLRNAFLQTLSGEEALRPGP